MHSLTQADFCIQSESDLQTCRTPDFALGQLEYLDCGTGGTRNLSNLRFYQPVRWETTPEQIVAFRFGLADNYLRCVEGYHPMKVRGAHLTFITYPGKVYQRQSFFRGSRIQGVNVGDTPDAFLKGFALKPENLNPTLRTIFDKTAIAPYFRQVELPRVAEKIVRELLSCTLSGTKRAQFFTVRISALHNLGMEAALKLTDDIGNLPITLQINDYSALCNARDIIATEFSATPTLGSLARRVGINRTKLALGFKHVFGAGVFEYCQQLQLQTAQKILLEGKRAIGAVAEQVGYQSAASFTRAYRNHFGYPPSREGVKQPLSAGKDAGM